MTKNARMNLVINGLSVIIGFGIQTMTPFDGLGGFVAGYGLCALGQQLSNMAKANKERKLKQDASAVSPVIGVILMVAITVVLAAIVFVLVSSLSHQNAETPRISLATETGENFTVISADRGLYWDDFTAEGCNSIPIGTVTAGDRLEDCDGTLTLVYEPANAVVYRYP